jgi:hypothetical protein
MATELPETNALTGLLASRILEKKRGAAVNRALMHLPHEVDVTAEPHLN